MPKFGVDPEATKPLKPAVPGIYELRLKDMSAVMAKSEKGINFNAQLEICNSKPEENGKVVFFNIWNGPYLPSTIFDFVHAFGFDLEKNGEWPGGDKTFEVDPKDPEIKKIPAKYKGVLLGKVCKAELVVDTYEGNERSAVKMFLCAVKDCSTKYPENRHRTNLIGKKKD